MFDISTRRFRIVESSYSPGCVDINDARAPYYTKLVKRDKLPSFDAMARMSEDTFDKIIAKLIYP